MHNITGTYLVIFKVDLLRIHLPLLFKHKTQTQAQIQSQRDVPFKNSQYFFQSHLAGGTASALCTTTLTKRTACNLTETN